ADDVLVDLRLTGSEAVGKGCRRRIRLALLQEVEGECHRRGCQVRRPHGRIELRPALTRDPADRRQICLARSEAGEERNRESSDTDSGKHHTQRCPHRPRPPWPKESRLIRRKEGRKRERSVREKN